MYDDWLARWREGRIGWHETNGNRSLQRYWQADGLRVLVPLCGKSVDLFWLAARGNVVTGVELSEIAVRDFFADHELDYEVSADGTRFRAKELPLTLVCGDYFSYTETGFDAHYDRGALIAIPHGRRADYARHTTARLAENPVQLVITLEYDQEVVDGPPYAVSPAEVLSYWPGLSRVETANDIANAPPKFLAAGLDKLTEVVWQRC